MPQWLGQLRHIYLLWNAIWICRKSPPADELQPLRKDKHTKILKETEWKGRKIEWWEANRNSFIAAYNGWGDRWMRENGQTVVAFLSIISFARLSHTPAKILWASGWSGGIECGRNDSRKKRKGCLIWRTNTDLWLTVGRCVECV